MSGWKAIIRQTQQVTGAASAAASSLHGWKRSNDHPPCTHGNYLCFRGQEQVMHFQGILHAPMAKAIPSTQNVAAQRCDFPPRLWGWGGNRSFYQPGHPLLDSTATKSVTCSLNVHPIPPPSQTTSPAPPRGDGFPGLSSDPSIRAAQSCTDTLLLQLSTHSLCLPLSPPVGHDLVAACPSWSTLHPCLDRTPPGFPRPPQPRRLACLPTLRTAPPGCLLSGCHPSRWPTPTAVVPAAWEGPRYRLN